MVIVSEEAIAKGIRRIIAVTGTEATKVIKKTVNFIVDSVRITLSKLGKLEFYLRLLYSDVLKLVSLLSRLLKSMCVCVCVCMCVFNNDDFVFLFVYF